MNIESQLPLSAEQQPDALEDHLHDMQLIKEWFDSLEGFGKPEIRRDVLSAWSNEDFIDFIQKCGAITAGQSEGLRNFDGTNVTLGSIYVPDQRDKTMLLGGVWETVKAILNDRNLNDEDALNYGSLVAAAGVVLVHPYSDGNGRASRLALCAIMKGNAEEDWGKMKSEELDILMSEDGKKRWPTAPWGQSIYLSRSNNLFVDIGGWERIAESLDPQFDIDLNIGEIAEFGFVEERASFETVPVKDKLLQFVECDIEPIFALYHFYQQGDVHLKDMFLRHVNKASHDAQIGTLDTDAFFTELESDQASIRYHYELNESIRLIRQTAVRKYLEIIRVNKPTALWERDNFTDMEQGLRYIHERSTTEGKVTPLDYAVGIFIGIQESSEKYLLNTT